MAVVLLVNYFDDLRMEGFMSTIPTIAAIIALVGAVGFVASSLAHAGSWGDIIFNVAAVCLVIAPLTVVGWFIIESCKEVARSK